MTNEQKERIDEIKKLKEGWFDIDKGKPINNFAIHIGENLLDKLPPDFEVFPLSDGYIQIECTRGSKYLEIEIQENRLKIFWQITKNNVPICEGEDVFLYITENIYTKICLFVNFFFNDL